MSEYFKVYSRHSQIRGIRDENPQTLRRPYSNSKAEIKNLNVTPPRRYVFGLSSQE